MRCYFSAALAFQPGARESNGPTIVSVLKKINSFMNQPKFTRGTFPDRRVKTVAQCMLWFFFACGLGVIDVHAESMENKGLLTPLYGSQAITVSGTVNDETGQALPGVNVVEKGTTNGTTTDATGRFSLNVQGESSVLVFSFIGYTTREITVANQTNFSINLQADVRALQEVVVVGYGTQEKVNLTGAVGVASGEQLQNRPI